MSKRTNKPSKRKTKKTRGGVNMHGRARARVKRDIIGGDKKVQGDEINAGGDANVVKVGAGATMGDIIFDGKRPPKPEELDAAKRAYLEFVIRANQDVKPPSVIDAQNRVTLQLDEIYVPVTITFKELRAETDKKDKRDKSQEEPPKRIELAQIVRDSPRAVLLGEPGAGKTTILRYLALHFAKTLLEHLDYGVNVRDGDTDFGAARLPIFIRLATFASAKRTLREYILDAFGDVEHKEAVKQVLTEAMSQGKALILLDGLDEILDNATESRDARAHVIDQIESFDAGLQGHNQIIVTSRRSGYGRAVGGAFKAFDLNELEQEQIAKFLMHWNLAIEKKRIQEYGETFQTEQEREQAVKERAQEQPTKIAEKLDANLGAQNLAKNPLTLRMLAETYRWSGDLPTRRVDLYNLIVKQSLEFWETQVAGIPKGRNVSRREAITRLAPLAYWMHSENESPSEDQITERLGDILALKLKLEPAHPDVENAVEDFWTRAKERTGLFVHDTPNHYRFVHATFREYFAGLYLVQDHENAAQRIYAHRHQPRWEEPILLALSSVPDATELIRTAILANSPEANEKNFTPSDYDDVLHRDFFFAARCVADGANIDDALQKEMGEQLVEWWYEFGTWPGPMEPWRWQTWESMEHAVRFTLMNLRGTKVSEYMRARFLEELAKFEKNPFEPQNNRLTQNAQFEWMQNPYHTLEMWIPYRGLVLLGEECTPQVINFFMRLMRTHHTFAFTIGKDEIEDLMKKEAAMKPALEEMLKGDQESKLFAAILLGEYKKTTPEALKSLFDFCLEDALFDDEQEDDSKSNPDWKFRDRQSRLRQRKKDMQDRALKALLVIEKPLEGYLLSDITSVLWSEINSTNEQIESFFKAHAEELMVQHRFYRLTEKLRPYDLNRLTAAYLLIKLTNSRDALNILETAILKPTSWDLAKDSAKMLASLGRVNEGLVVQALEWSRSKHSGLRWEAIELLGDFKKPSPEVFTRLFELLDDRDVEYGIPKEAAQTLLKIGDIPAEFLPQLLAGIKHDEATRDDTYIRVYMVQILAEFKIALPESAHREVAETLFALFPEENQDRSILDDAEVVLGDLAVSPTVMPLLLNALKFGRDGLRARVGWAIRQKFGIGHRVITNPDSPLATWIYSKVDIPIETIKILIDGLRDDNSEVAIAASAALSYTLNKPSELIDGLRALLQDSSDWARYRAMDRLLDLEYKEDDIVETWLDLIKSEDEELRAEVAEKISRLPSSVKLMGAAWSLAKNERSVRVKAECFMYLVKLDLDNDKAINLLVPPLEDDVDLSEDAIDNVEALPPEIQERMALKIAARSVLHEFDELPPRVQAALVRQTLSSNPKVRKEAIESLRFKARLDSILAARLLVLLGDENGAVWQETCELIDELFGKYPVGFMDERKAIAEKLYRLSKEKRVHPIPTPPPASGPNVPFIVPTSPVPVPSSELAEPEAKVEHGTFYDGEGAPFLIEEDAQKGISVPSIWGALWAVAATLSTTNQKPTTV